MVMIWGNICSLQGHGLPIIQLLWWLHGGKLYIFFNLMATHYAILWDLRFIRPSV